MCIFIKRREFLHKLTLAVISTEIILKKRTYNPLLFCGLVAPVIFISSFLIQGMFKKGYDSLRHPISSLSIGENGWIQVLTFIVTGTLMLIFSVEIQSRLKDKLLTVVLVLTGIGLIASGIFTTDPLFGYPANEPNISKEFSVQGKLHSIFALLVFIGIPILCFRMSSYFNLLHKQAWRYYSIVTGITMLLLFVLTSLALNNFLRLKHWAGLIQRLCVIIGFVWISFWAISLHFQKKWMK